MTIGRKILGGYALMLVLLILVAAMAFRSLQSLEESYTGFLDVDMQSVVAATALADEAAVQIAHYRGILAYPEELNRFSGELRESHQRFGVLLEKVRSFSRSDEGRRLVGEIAAAHDRMQEGQEEGIRRIGAGDREGALALGATLVPLSAAVQERTSAYIDLQQELLTEARRAAASAARNTRLQLVGMSILAIALAVLLGTFLARSVTGQLRETINQLSASSAEILATTSQVAAGAAETATSVSQTTATVEEVKQTAQLSNQKARYVSDSAQKASQVAQSGRGAVEGTVEGMQRIQEQMESIAETIVRLSEQSQSIGQMIATVNDLAEQSNLLAVNAAIEAARAGEHGKGFAVVAQEIRSLADQSKQATAQVRTILGEVQKATSAAVLATEQGHKAVGTGVRQSGEAGESIRLLADSIMDAAQAATQISASSQQQMVGMDQVALAMENIKQASLQNVAATRQAEAAAQSLHQLGQRLTAVIEGQSR